MSSKQQIAVGVDVTASGTHITLMAQTDTNHMEVIYSEFHPMPPAQKQSSHASVPRELLIDCVALLDAVSYYKFGEPVTPADADRRRMADKLRALLNGGEVWAVK